MPSFTSQKLDKSATIKACNQLSKICEVIITRLSIAEIEKYTRENKVAADVTSRYGRGQTWGNSSDNIQVNRHRGRPRKSHKPPNKKHVTFDDEISSNRNSGPVVEFVDCSLNMEKLNASTCVTFKLQTPEFVEDKICNVLEGNLLNENSESRHNNAGGKKKQKSVRFAEEDKTCKRIRLDGNSKSYHNNNNTNKSSGSTVCFHENSSQSSLYCNKDRKKILFNKNKEDEIHDSGKQMIIDEKSSDSGYKGGGITKHMVFLSEPDSVGTHQQAHNVKPISLRSFRTSKAKGLSCDPLPTPTPTLSLPLPIKSENAAETMSDGGSDSKPFHVSNTASPDDSVIKSEVEMQIEFSQAGHEDFTEMCVSISDGNFNKQITLDAALLSSNDSTHGTRNNLVVLDNCSVNDALQNVETITTPRTGIEFSPVISAVGTAGELETQHASFESQSVSAKREMEMSSQSDEEYVTGRRNRVTDSDMNGYFVKSGVSSPPKSEENKESTLSVLDDCITIVDDDDDDNDEVIELTDSEEIINCDDDDDDDEVLPVKCNDNKSEENLSAYLESDESSRFSLNSNTSEELVDLTTENGNIIVFDGVSSIQLSSDEESITKTCVNENRLSSVSDLATPCSVVVGDAIISQENGDDTTNHDEVIIFDDVSTVELNSTGDFTSSVENHTSSSLLETFLNRSDNTYNKLIATTGVVYGAQTLSNKNSHLNKATTDSDMSVGVTSGNEEHSSEDVHVGKIRVKDPSNLGILSSVQHGDSSKNGLLEKELTSKPVAGAESTEIEKSDFLVSMRKAIWSNSGFTNEEKIILRLYKKYFDDNTEEIIKKMGQTIHLAVCDNLNYIKYSEQVRKLLTGDTIIIEKMKAESLHNADVIKHGTNFVKFLKEFVNKVNISDLQDMVFIMFCRALDSFLRIDSGNKKYYRMARDVLREMLAKVNCDKYYKLDRIVYMDTYLFLKRYNATIRLIGRYCEFVSKLRSQFKSKLSESVAVSNVQVKQSTIDSFVNLKNVMLQEQPVTYTTNTNAFTASSDQSGTVLLEKSKQPLVKGVLLLNGENMTKVCDFSIDELLQLNKQVYINLKQKYFLQSYQKYFLGTTEDKLLKLGELLHVITCEMLCQNKKLESINTLPHSSLKICEEGKILTAYKNNLKQRGFDFIQLMKGITSKFHGHCFARMVCAMYCRITEIFLKIDINNIKYFVIVREVVKKMLELNEFDNKDLFDLLTMKEEDFVRSYNSVIHMLLVYYELVKSAESQNADDSAGNSSGSELGAVVSHKASEGNIIIPLSTRAVEVPIIKRISKNSILIV